jgi:hypothetical protein
MIQGAIEQGGQAAQALGGMDAEHRFPGDLDPVVRLHPLDRRRIARLLAEVLRCLDRFLATKVPVSFSHLLASESFPPRRPRPPGQSARRDAVGLPGPLRDGKALAPSPQIGVVTSSFIIA